jgi:hypothetical protein
VIYSSPENMYPVARARSYALCTERDEGRDERRDEGRDEERRDEGRREVGYGRREKERGEGENSQVSHYCTICSNMPQK